MGSSGTSDRTVVLETGLTGLRHVPIRVAFAFLSGGRLFWLLAVVVVPLALVVGSLWIHPFVARFLVGIPVMLLLVFWSSSDRYRGSQTTIDPSRRRLQFEHSSVPRWSGPSTRDLDDVTDVSIVQLGEAVLVRLEDAGFSSVPDFAVSKSDLSVTIEALRASGIDTIRSKSPSNRGSRVSEPLIRLVVSPLVLLLVPVYGVLRFGAQALVGSDIAVVAWVGFVWMVEREVTNAYDLRPDGAGRRVLFDIVVTGTLLVVVVVVGLITWRLLA